MKLLKLGGVLAVVGALYGGWLMLRDAPLFQVEKVAVSGLGGPVVPAVRTRLEQAGRGMTTTHVDVAALDQSVAAYTVVKSLRVHTEFPHGLSIEVVEQLPVASLVVGDTSVNVAADGVVIHGVDGSLDGLPTLEGGRLPTRDRVRDPQSLDALAVVAVAPTPLRRMITKVANGADGLTAYLRDGPAVYFGDTTLLHAKWAAAARVLADPESRGAAYLDVRLPDRPAAGIDDPATSAATTAGEPETAGAPLVADDAASEASTSTGG